MAVRAIKDLENHRKSLIFYLMEQQNVILLMGLYSPLQNNIYVTLETNHLNLAIYTRISMSFQKEWRYSIVIVGC